MRELRHFTRVEVKLGAELIYRGKAFPVTVEDISLGGAFISADLELQVGEEIELRIFLTRPEHTIEVEGQIVWCKGLAGAGIAFQDLKPYDVWSLLKQTNLDPKEALTKSF